METKANPRGKKANHKVLRRILICSGVLLLGIIGMTTLAGLKKPPKEVKVDERAIRVEVLKTQAEDVEIYITGYGEAQTLRQVEISPEVSGRIVATHPRLKVGEIIPKGDILFQIDERNYIAARDEARAAVQQWKTAIARLKKQQVIDAQRLKTLERNRALAKSEFERLRSLEARNVSSRSGVERAEQAYNTASDQAAQMAVSVTLYPIRIKEAQSSLAAARARLVAADANLERAQVRALFDGRLKAVSIENGEYVSPGKPALTLADDSILEIQVPIDSRDARQWLRFDAPPSGGQTAWFSGLTPVKTRIHWTEDKSGHSWEGALHRVVKFDQKTRTLTLAVRVDAAAARAGGGGLPLVEGMFCSVSIPGRTLYGVFRVPRQAVSFEETVFLADGNRLKTLPVVLARTQGQEAFIAGGIADGDLVITTRLVDPLENALLHITNLPEEDSRS
ncbi:RND efflux system, membrane fusion protein [Olavius algarvensis associated proteobacterium Delta 3]|nr:RND efflux system, membrane fusion protein [Olavius algarvensis associated proteobacterium Delta 3]